LLSRKICDRKLATDIIDRELLHIRYDGSNIDKRVEKTAYEITSKFLPFKTCWCRAMNSKNTTGLGHAARM